ncbi:Thioesterase/thiol ester dehydrase-isomerase [Fomitiporia mediterranea MF3/22]|uniref:Thioesterase/thiol ester dehydrase-isomerase n=1 Tax=Fomitiporia mediterranea (strain MF3/22) TaxID=694068 RepID=UPI0004409CAC|nr:Thioesterase/thiol ester dehydrase-isomerase [Fomitiporia mediterranea MF3/22]EJD07482.1 Thioesterase/thiol ester dehydrase-isomerase [Fomitiporia mediterranea MF3/22]
MGTIGQLRAAFRDKSSPFYLESGSQGPSSPGDGFVIPEKEYIPARELHTKAAASSEDNPADSSGFVDADKEGREKLLEQGFDPESFFEQKVVWGDMDSFQHVNNVRYLRFLETGRMHWILSLGRKLGGEQKARDMITGKGISVILGEVSIKYRRPLLYPDTIIVAHKPHNPHPTHFGFAAAIWSNSQRTFVATSDSKLVWYDYDRLKKCDPGAEVHAVLGKRIRT